MSGTRGLDGQLRDRVNDLLGELGGFWPELGGRAGSGDDRVQRRQAVAHNLQLRARGRNLRLQSRKIRGRLGGLIAFQTELRDRRS
jgi:hypothetical protein